ncbi:MAG: Galactoside transport system permease protein MglC [Bacteroidetes bacterium ADurb.Bin408]|nr:MAG: Galactoside transport system permease protein MglC [Bacteroidetes bacterium ADurb.Bin408]
MFILIAGSADLSGGRMVGLTAVIAGSLAQASTYSHKFFPDLPELFFVFPILAAIGVGLVFGLVNGFAVSVLKVPAFLATLGISMILYGINLLYFNLPPNNAQPLGGFTKDFANIGTGDIFGIPILVIISVGCMIFVYILLTKTTLGKEIYAVGGNAEAARVSGINVFKILLFIFAIAGALYGLGGSMEAARTGSATSNYGNSYELDAIASCIVGGCSLSGGVGTVPGVVLGVIVFTVINYGLTFIGISTNYQYIIKGLIIIFAIALDVRKNFTKK